VIELIEDMKDETIKKEMQRYLTTCEEKFQKDL